MKKKIITVIVFILLAGLLVFYFYYLSNKEDHSTDEVDVKISVAKELAMRNLETNYPPTPREVVKYYNDITKCYYNEEYSDEELEELARKSFALFDEKLVSNNEFDEYFENLKAQILDFKGYRRTISTYSLSSSIDVENSKFFRDGYEWVKVYSYFTLSEGGRISASSEVFLLRKDDSGHWKIFGWDLAQEY